MGALLVTGPSFMNTLNVTNSGTFGSLMVNSVNMTPSSGDVFKEQISNLSNNTSGNIVNASTSTPWQFNGAVVRSFEILASASLLVSNGNRYAFYKIYGINQGSDGSGGYIWYINTAYVGNATNLIFGMTNSGTMTYTSGNTSTDFGGTFISNTLKYRALTTSV
jgi:hypothetical protein